MISLSKGSMVSNSFYTTECLIDGGEEKYISKKDILVNDSLVNDSLVNDSLVNDSLVKNRGVIILSKGLSLAGYGGYGNRSKYGIEDNNSSYYSSSSSNYSFYSSRSSGSSSKSLFNDSAKIGLAGMAATTALGILGK